MLKEKIKRLISRLPVRLLVSVMVGIIVSKALTMLAHAVLSWAGIFPPLGEPMFEKDLVFIALVIHSVFAIVSAYITAIVAKEKARKAVYILGTKEAILWVLGIILLWKHSPPWFNLAKAVLGIPLAMFGGQLYIWYKKRKEQRESTNPKVLEGLESLDPGKKIRKPGGAF
jgi:uncharacterized membrane protein